MPIFNDLDLSKWKESDIWTDSLWLISERDKSGKHSNFYHGNFIPQIPRQLIKRYTKKNEIVLDPFVGSGTTAYEAESLCRNFIGIDIQPELISHIASKVDNKDYFSELLVGDSANSGIVADVQNVLKSREKEKVHFALLHPPYADIIKFSNLKEDLSNSESLLSFLSKFASVLRNTIKLLHKNRYLAVVIGDKYTKGQWVPLGFYCMQEAQKLGLTLKSIVIKNMEGNRGKQNKEGIWKYRALASDYYIFKHEYVMIFKKN